MMLMEGDRIGSLDHLFDEIAETEEYISFPIDDRQFAKIIFPSCAICPSTGILPRLLKCMHDGIRIWVD
jgi:hypothetical protein